MPAIIRRFAFSAALACAALPARGAGMPDYGTRNFDPGVATPSYFTNENGTVLGTPEIESADGGAETPARSVEAVSEAPHSYRTTGHHHAYRASYSSKSHAASIGGKGHATGAGEAKVSRTASMGRSAKSSRPEHAIHATASTRTAGGAGTRPAKSSLRHASAKSPSRKG